KRFLLARPSDARAQPQLGRITASMRLTIRSAPPPHALAETGLTPVSWAVIALVHEQASEFHPIHYRPAGRRFSRLLWTSGAAHAAYRFDRSQGHAVQSVLRGKSGMHAQPREPDDGPDAVGARRAQQRHSAVDAGSHLRRAVARCGLPHRARRQEPPAELHGLAADRQTVATTRGLSRAVSRSGAGAAQRPRSTCLRAGDARVLARRECAGANAVLRLRARLAGARAQRGWRWRLHPLAYRARSQGEGTAGAPLGARVH